MKKLLAVTLGAVLGMSCLTDTAQASWASCHYGGYQPWWNIFACRNRNLVLRRRASATLLARLL